MRKERPERYPVTTLFDPICDYFLSFTMSIMNYLDFWHCAYCGKMHSPMVKKYKILHGGYSEDVCSLGKQEGGA